MDFDHATLKVYQGDICALDVSAIVNCTNGKFVSKPGTSTLNMNDLMRVGITTYIVYVMWETDHLLCIICLRISYEL